MNQRVSKLDKEELIVIGSAAFMLMIMLVLFSLLMHSMVERENVLLRYEAEQTLADFLFRIQTGNVAGGEFLKENSTVRGLGIYASDGAMIFGLGAIPGKLQVDSYTFEDGNIAQYDQSSGMIEYLRQAKISFTATFYEQGFFPDVPDRLTMPIAEYLYISFDGSEYRQKILMGKVLNALMFIAMLSIFLFLWRIFKRNQHYRKTLAKQESLVRMGEAARTLAHEIKNPLSALSLQAAVLKKTLPEGHSEGISVIEHEVQRLNTLTNRVGDFLRNPVGEPVDVDIEQLIEQIISTFPLAIALKIETRWPALVQMDRDRARSVFENLIKNAVESSDEGDAQVSIHLVTSRHQVFVKVEDRGDGLPEGDIEQLFDPFFTTKVHGSGIGLAITRRFIDAAHGTIAISPRDGGGTTAQVILPRSS